MRCTPPCTLVSVIVPVYNVEKYLENCVVSILTQTYKNIELILINDGSSDSSGSICNKYAAIDERVRVVHQVNSGVAIARNNGLKKARGEYILWVDSDDTIHNNLIRRCIEVIESEKPDIICFNYAKVFGERIKPILNYNDKMSTDDIIRKTIYDNNCGASLWDKFYKASIWNGVLFKEKIKCEDLWVMPILFCKANRITSIKDIFYYYNVDNQTSIMHTIKNDELYLYYEFLIYKEYEKNLGNKFNVNNYLTGKALKQALKVYNRTVALKFLKGVWQGFWK